MESPALTLVRNYTETLDVPVFVVEAWCILPRKHVQEFPLLPTDDPGVRVDPETGRRYYSAAWL